MYNLYRRNGFIFWDEEEIKIRKMFEDTMVLAIKQSLLKQNSAFQLFQVEAPTLIPRSNVHENYTDDDIFVTQENDLVLRPETTKSSYFYAEHILHPHNEIKVKLPIVVWQHAKSYRNEKDKVLSHMRLKEFYQLEFQILYSKSTKNDYSIKIIEDVKHGLETLIGDCRVEPSDRLPDYSLETTDIICENTNMEICSISKRTDYLDHAEDVMVLEVAIGTDRCVYNFKNKQHS